MKHKRKPLISKKYLKVCHYLKLFIFIILLFTASLKGLPGKELCHISRGLSTMENELQLCCRSSQSVSHLLPHETTVTDTSHLESLQPRTREFHSTHCLRLAVTWNYSCRLKAGNNFNCDDAFQRQGSLTLLRFYIMSFFCLINDLKKETSEACHWNFVCTIAEIYTYLNQCSKISMWIKPNTKKMNW